jgi:hypothetical protein
MLRWQAIAAGILLAFAPLSDALADPPSAACTAILDQVRDLKSPGDQPAMMAAGDSLTNGVTSLTMDQLLASHSWPTLVAKALGMPKFGDATYPPNRPILSNFESDLQGPILGLLFGLGSDLQSDISYWQNTYPVADAPGMPDFFDDIAVAQADSQDMMCDTAAINQVKLNSTPLDPDFLGIPSNLGDWYYWINARFILNPKLTNASPIALPPAVPRSQLSQLAQVLLRKPKRLLMWIGNNDGVWLMAFDSYVPTTSYPDGESTNAVSVTVQQEIDYLVANQGLTAKYIADSYSAAGLQAPYVYLVDLPLPSRAANLDPVIDAQQPRAQQLGFCSTDTNHTGLKYFNYYTNYLTMAALEVRSRDEVCAMDAAISKANDDIETAMRKSLGNRLVRIKINDTLLKYDGKHVDGAGVPVKLNGQNVKLDNEVLHTAAPGIWRSGGLMGYDNMHPTWVAYAVVAQTIATAISQNEHLPPPNNDAISPQALVDEIEHNHYTSSLNMSVIADQNLASVRPLFPVITPGAAAPAQPATPPSQTPEAIARRARGRADILNLFSIVNGRHAPH